ncbi:unnamed protein product [Closterium sp. NIES-65]|nr:unnamed protein product [Closterium sp. NIES-65]
MPILSSFVSPSTCVPSLVHFFPQIVRLLAVHPSLQVTVMTADRKAGLPLSSVFPHLISQVDLPNMVAVADADFSQVDAVFCCLPHGTTQEIIAALPEHLKIVDLSADFRLRDVNEYAQWYGGEHRAPKLQEEAVYGLTEIYRDAVKAARLVANPGCYPTSVQLPLIPLLQSKLILPDGIIIDAKSGVSGAGRGAKEANLYTEVAEGIHPYGVTNHRHVPEIEQGLKEFAGGADVTVSFTPHLMPMSRGMLSTIYVQMAPGATVDDLREHLISRYQDEEFVVVLPKGIVPHTRHVRGSNYCLVNVFPDRIPGRAIITSVSPAPHIGFKAAPRVLLPKPRDTVAINRLAILLMWLPVFAILLVILGGASERLPVWDTGLLDDVDEQLTRRALAQLQKDDEMAAVGRTHVVAPKIAFLFIVRGPLPLAPVWERFFKGHQGRYSVHVHVSTPNFTLDDVVDSPSFKGTQVPGVRISWGGPNLIRAEKRLLAAALEDPGNQRFVLVSDKCLPIFNFTYVWDYLFATNVSFITSYESGWRWVFTMAPTIKRHQFRKGSQWFALTRAHAALIVRDRKYYDLFVETFSEIPDESYIQTVLAIEDPENVDTRSVLYVHWGGAISRHPASYTPEEINPGFIRKVQNSPRSSTLCLPRVLEPLLTILKHCLSDNLRSFDFEGGIPVAILDVMAEVEGKRVITVDDIKTVPMDFRFPTANQAKHCFTCYNEFHKCIAEKGEGASECQKFAKAYRTLCPAEWVDKWNEDREQGIFVGRY